MLDAVLAQVIQARKREERNRVAGQPTCYEAHERVERAPSVATIEDIWKATAGEDPQPIIRIAEAVSYRLKVRQKMREAIQPHR